MKIRVGFGFDVHQLKDGNDFWIGGIKHEHSKGADGHSDADVLIHAICDALLGAEYRPAKFLKAALAYRLIEKNQFDGTYSFRHRIMLDITLKKKVGKFALSYRNRLQREIRNINTSESGILPEWYSRNKFTVKYDLGKAITPYVSAEFRYQIVNPRARESDGTWHRNRYAAGIDYKRNDRNTFGLYYLIQNEYNVSAPQNLYIIGIEYSLSL
jgi:hypothetical protein